MLSWGVCEIMRNGFSARGLAQLHKGADDGHFSRIFRASTDTLSAPLSHIGPKHLPRSTTSTSTPRKLAQAEETQTPTKLSAEGGATSKKVATPVIDDLSSSITSEKGLADE